MNQQEKLDSKNQNLPESLKIESASVDALSNILQKDDVLMALNFSDETKVNPEDARFISVGINALDSKSSIEVWRGEGRVSCHQEGRITWCENDNYLIGHILVDESGSCSLDVIIEHAYKEIGDFLCIRPYMHVFRIWNYIPAIHKIHDGVERYQTFCVGRHAAWGKRPNFEQGLPAASAVGTGVPGILISFAAGRYKVNQVENPRQISAFRYPPVYSPKCPLFSRAVSMRLPEENRHKLYISGTASIVGHKTQHNGNIKAQTEETCKNIDALLDCFSTNLGSPAVRSIPLDYSRVYLRDTENFEIVRKILNIQQLTTENIVFIKADICRTDLMLEVEGVFSLASRV